MENNSKIGIEPISEYKIEEISYEGNELYASSPSFIEYINELTEKINFSIKSPTSLDTKDKSKLVPQNKLPWESIHEKLRNALIEINVLSDVLKITKQQQYLALDFITNDNVESKPSLVLLSKKKALSRASSILFNGAEGIKALFNRPSVSIKSNNNFHLELLNLRQNWRIRKVGAKIIGDISYKTVGSSYRENGNFEIIKNSEKSNLESSLQIILPKALNNSYYLHISFKNGTILKTSSKINISTLEHFSQFGNNISHKKLEEAQNTLFCKEVFNKLVMEAMQDKTQVLSHEIKENSICISLFPHIKIIISLKCEIPDGSNSFNQEIDDGETGRRIWNGEPIQEANYLRILGFALQAHLLRSLHRSRLTDRAEPTCASLFESQRKRLSGPRALRNDDCSHPQTSRTISSSVEGSQNEDDCQELSLDQLSQIRFLKFRRAEQLAKYAGTVLLKPITDMARHLYLRIRTLEVIDNFAQTHVDPLLIVHSSGTNDSLHSSLTINIITKGYEALCRTSLYLQIYCDTLKVVLRDGRVLWLSHDPRDLIDTLRGQVSQHQINAVQSLSKLMNWQTLSNESFNGSDPRTACGYKPTICLKSPNEKWTLQIDSDFDSNSIYLSMDRFESESSTTFPSSLLRGRRGDRRRSFNSNSETISHQKLNLDQIPSPIFLCKVEYLMALLKYV